MAWLSRRDPGLRLSDLVDAGYLEREGRRNSYRIRPDRPLRHPLEHGHHIGEILGVLNEESMVDESAVDVHV